VDDPHILGSVDISHSSSC